MFLNGDASRQELLLEENIESTDVFCALANMTEAKYHVVHAGESIWGGRNRYRTIINNLLKCRYRTRRQ